MKRLDTQSLAGINIGNNFLNAALELIIPLYLIERHFSLESIGIMLSVLPLVFMVVRIILSIIGDGISTRAVFVINGIFSILAPIIYVVSVTPLGFGIGRVAQGISTSGFWAVVRTQTYRIAKKGSEEDAASFMLAMRTLGSFLGRIFVISVGILAFSTEHSLLALSVVGATIVMLSYILSDGKPLRKQVTLKQTLKRYTEVKRLALPSLIMIFGAIPDAPVFAYLIPVFLTTVRGVELFGIGVSLIIFSFGYISTIHLCKQLKFPNNTIYLITALFSVTGLLLFPIVGLEYLPVVMLMCGIGMGAGGILFEEVIYHTVSTDGWVSLDIGMIHVPYRFAEFISLGLAGFAVISLGFEAAFAICALSMVIFVLLSREYISRNLPSFKHSQPNAITRN